MSGPTKGPLVSADEKGRSGLTNLASPPPKAPQAVRRAFELKPYFGTRFRVFRRLGKAVLYEFDPATGRQTGRLTFQPGKNRTYYQPADMVLQCELDEKQLYGRYPELRPREGGESLLLTLAKALTFPPSTPSYYNVATMITRIEPWGDSGNGCIHGRPVVFFGDRAVQLDHTASWSVPQFQEAFHHVRLSRGLMQMAKICETVSSVLMEVALGGAKGLVKKSAAVFVVRRGAVRSATAAAAEYAARSIGRQMLAALPGALAAATAAFAKEMGASLSASRAEGRLRELALRGEQGALRRDSALRNAVSKGCVAFASTLVSQTLGMGLGKVVERSELIRSGVGKYVADRLLNLLLLQKWQSLAKVLVDAAAAMREGKTGNKTYVQVVVEKLKGEGQALLGGEVKNVLSQIPSAMFGG